MNENKVIELYESVMSETITPNTYLCLKEDYVNGPYGEWGWSEKWEIIKDNFLYIFIPASIGSYNQNKKEKVFRNELLEEMLDEAYCFSFDVTKEEFELYLKWSKVQSSKTFEEFKKDSKKLCKFLTKNGYRVDLKLYENPKKALKKALELDRYVPEGEEGFGEFLRLNIKE